MVYRTIIHLNIELQIPVIYRADLGLRGFTPFASKCSRDDPNAAFLVGEGRTRSRFLLLFCVWVAVTFYFHFVGQLPGAGRRLQAKWHRKLKGDEISARS